VEQRDRVVRLAAEAKRQPRAESMRTQGHRPTSVRTSPARGACRGAEGRQTTANR
jgi:hypothetical protein